MSYLLSDLKIVSLSFCRAEEILSSQLSNEATTSNIVKIPNSNSDNVFKISYDSPNQPQNFDFPRTGPKGHERSFQPTWFKSFLWLHYDERTDSAFCFTCVKAPETNSLSLRSLYLRETRFSNKVSRTGRERPKNHEASQSMRCRKHTSVKRVKTYLRSTMKQDRLNDLMMIHVCKDRIDRLSITDMTNEFASRNHTRRVKFGRFREQDLKLPVKQEVSAHKQVVHDF